MAEEMNVNEPVDELEESISADKKARRAARTAKRLDEKGSSLNINSMMDMMTIILVFLLKSYSSEPIQINQSDDLRLPFSTTELTPEDTMTISITKSFVMVEDQAVVPVNDGRIDPRALQSSESLIIPDLQARIEEEMEAKEQWRRAMGGESQRVVTIIADSEVRYDLLTQVMVTANAAQVANFKFAAIQREQGSGLLQVANGP